MTEFTATTIVARNYLAQARVLKRSFVENNAGVDFVTLIVDGDERDRSTSGVGTVLLPTDLGIELRELHFMMLIYDVMEFSTALKAALLSTLLHTSDAVAYFDPDIRIYAPLFDIFETARDRSIVVTPHALHPLPRDGFALSERSIMQAGMFNLGFIAVGYGARPFLAWWHERLARDAIVDVENALFTDQRWADWLPSLFPTVISRDSGLNAAYWNLHERSISGGPSDWRAGDSPLRFFHFSGFDPEVPWMLSKHQGGRPRVLLSDSLELRALCLAYKDELDEFEHSRLRHAPYGLATLPGGFVLTSEIRRVARRSLVGELPVFPPVADAIENPRAFVSWLYDSSVGICPAQWIRWDTRPDLQHAFPDPLDRDAESFQDWWFGDMNPAPARRYLRRSPRARQSKTPKRRAFGWSVIAYARGELGIGEAGRRIADVVAACGLPMELVGTTLSSTSRQGHAAVRDVRDTVGFENVITCVNADILPSLSDRLELPKLRGQHVGLWFWELEEFPGHYGRSLALVHEVWAASEFTRRAIQRITDKPVRLIRLPIEIPDQPTAFTRRSLGMPESDFVFLTNFDYLSVSERKNPGGVIRAYMAAFGPDDGVRLIVKSINSGLRVADSERTRSFAAGRSDVLFFDDYVSSSQIKAMIELADCYVSLHRSEGYGLNLADAMARGTPTIATGYSGNLEFMTPTTSILIPHTIVEVGPGAEPYNPHAIWAEPNLHAASTAMRRLFDDRALARTLAGRARDHVARWHSLAASTDSLRETLMGTAVGKRT